MAERRAARKAKKDNMTPDVAVSKLHMSVIKWVRNNVPTKETKFLHAHKVKFFIGNKAVDALVNESPWARANVKDVDNAELVFNDRNDAVEFMDEMLKNKMFHRAKKIPVTERDRKGRKPKKNKDEAKDKEDTDGGTAPNTPAPATPANAAAKKKKNKIRLDMHLEQVFLDTTDAYVWIYDPMPWYYWLGGTAIVLCIIAVCLFPLWPQWSRKGVHYISVAAAAFLVFIILLGVFKYIVFAALFALTGGKLKFWLFPNLTEDVGFFESFVPLYDYTYTGKKGKKDKDSDDEESDDSEDEDESKKDDDQSDDSTSKKSSTGKDFEMVDKNDTDAD